MEEILKPIVGAGSNVRCCWWYIRKGGRRPAVEYFDKFMTEDEQTRVSRTIEALGKGQSVPESCFKARNGKPKLFEFKSGKHRLLAFHLSISPKVAGYVIIHGCPKAGGTSSDIRSSDEDAAKSKMQECVTRLQQKGILPKSGVKKRGAKK